MIRWTVLVILGAFCAVGCGGKKAPTCEKVAAYLDENVPTAFGKTPTAKCEKEKWSATYRTCLMAAKDEMSAITCMAKEHVHKQHEEGQAAAKAKVPTITLQAADWNAGSEPTAISIRLPKGSKQNRCDDSSCVWQFSFGDKGRDYKITVRKSRRTYMTMGHAMHDSSRRTTDSATKRGGLGKDGHFVEYGHDKIRANLSAFVKGAKHYYQARCDGPPAKKHMANLRSICKSLAVK